MSDNSTSGAGDSLPEGGDLAVRSDDVAADDARRPGEAGSPGEAAPEGAPPLAERERPPEPGEEDGEIAVEVDAGDAMREEQPAGEEVVGEQEAGDEAEPTEEDRIAELEGKIEELEHKQKETYDRFLRATADLDNYRKRSRRDVRDARTDARAAALREMLPVMDNLERALDHAESSAESTGIAEGVRLVLRQFAQALERCDVTAIETEGAAFDPNVHEAISQLETGEHSPGSVVQVLQRGYKIGERLLRPSLVVVAKAPVAKEKPTEEPVDDSAGDAGGEDNSKEAE